MDSIACLYLERRSIDMPAILKMLRKNGIFYSTFTPYFITIEGAVENYQLPESLLNAIRKSGNLHLEGRCRKGGKEARVFLAFTTPYVVKEITEGGTIHLRRISPVNKIKIVRETRDERCIVDEKKGEEIVKIKPEGENVRKIELLDERELPFVIFPLSGEIFPELPSAPQAESIEKRIAVLINAERKRRGLKELIYSEEIADVARNHSKDMAEGSFFSHFSPRTGSPADRMKRSGVRFSVVTENIGLGKTADEIHLLLMDSSSHRCNILDREVEKFGVGAFYHEEQWWVTENFIREKKEFDESLLRGACEVAENSEMENLLNILHEKIKEKLEVNREFLDYLSKKFPGSSGFEIRYFRGMAAEEIVNQLPRPCKISYKRYGDELLIILIK